MSVLYSSSCDTEPGGAGKEQFLEACQEDIVN